MVNISIDELTFLRAVKQVRSIESCGSRETVHRLRSAMVQGIECADLDRSRGTTSTAGQLIQYLMVTGVGTDLEVVAAGLAGYYQRHTWWLSQPGQADS